MKVIILFIKKQFMIGVTGGGNSKNTNKKKQALPFIMKGIRWGRVPVNYGPMQV